MKHPRRLLWIGWCASALLVACAVGSANTSGASAFLCCVPAHQGVIVVVPCSPASAPCDGQCRSRTGLLSGGCQTSNNPFGSCREWTVGGTHTECVYTCQDNGSGSCPCPPAGDPSPDQQWSIPVNVNVCVGSGCW